MSSHTRVDARAPTRRRCRRSLAPCVGMGMHLQPPELWASSARPANFKATSSGIYTATASTTTSRVASQRTMSILWFTTLTAPKSPAACRSCSRMRYSGPSTTWIKKSLRVVSWVHATLTLFGLALLKLASSTGTPAKPELPKTRARTFLCVFMATMRL